MKTIEGLTVEQQAVNFETMRHIETVRNLIGQVVVELLDRAKLHDQSKLKSPEVEMFAEFSEKLYGLTYGSPEYNECKAQLGVALHHHYASNRHHPEHHDNGVWGMNLIDLIEMFCDWKAATLRHADGDIRKSIAINAERFEMSEQLAMIFANTISVIG